jgi:hypothetical protein
MSILTFSLCLKYVDWLSDKIDENYDTTTNGDITTSHSKIMNTS